jgi:sirohydrochlorin cobalto/nickelchelatase
MEFTYMLKKGMLLVGHGSTMPYNQELVEKTAAMIKEQNTDFIVKCGFMNMNTPTIRDSLNEFRHEPIDALVVVGPPRICRSYRERPASCKPDD